jgi:flagellar basal body-associated protein FliL
MTEPTQEKEPAATAAPATAAAPAAPGAATAPAAAAAGSRGPALPLLIAVIVGALGAGGAVGALVVAPRIPQGPPAAAAEGAHGGGEKGGKGKHGEAKTPMHKIESIIVNPTGSLGQRFLMASVAIELPTEKDVEALRQRDVQVRDAVVATLERETLASLTAPGARDSLRARLARSIRPFVRAGVEPHVYLPQFVVQ